MSTKCLYRCKTVNGVKLQACYPHNGICNKELKYLDGSIMLPNVQNLPLGTNINEPFKPFKKYQVINCKYPECL